MYARHFWYDGHHGEIVCEGRERYTSYLNGVEQDKGGHASSMTEDLVTEMKYRQERDPDFSVVCHGVLYFIDQHVPGRNDENEWVLMESIEEEVVLNDPVLALNAVHTLETDGYIEITKAYDTPNYQYLLRPTTEEVPEPEDLRGSLTNIWNEYE